MIKYNGNEEHFDLVLFVRDYANRERHTKIANDKDRQTD